MEKKNLKWYEAPVMEVVEMETSVSLLSESNGGTHEGDTNIPGVGDGDVLD